jgi:hypothetical protein
MEFNHFQMLCVKATIMVVIDVHVFLGNKF